MTAPSSDPPAAAPDPVLIEAVAYAQPAEQVLQELDSSASGLTTEQAKLRIGEYGRNELPQAPPKPAILRFLAHFDDVLIYILLVAAVLKAIIGDWVEFGVIGVAAFAIALVGFIQEGRANQALASIKSMLAEVSQTLRDGSWTVLPVEYLVPGDVVRLRSGDRVPADMRLLSEVGLQVDESVLTGESVPAEKSVAPVPPGSQLGDRTCMVYSGTIVTKGTGEAVVVSTGGATEIGRITKMVSEVEQTETPLARQLGRLGKQIAILIGIMAVVMLLVGYFVHHLAVADLISAAISFAVAAVPEGLPALVTITLALGVQQMAKRRAIVRKMDSIETLGAVNTVCSDKTGTLTKNQMTATVVMAGEREYRVSGEGYSPEGTIEPSDFSPVMQEMLLAAGMVNEAKLEKTDGGWGIVGAPTEGAMQVLVVKAGTSLDGYVRLGGIPFESSHKFSATLDEPVEESLTPQQRREGRKLHVVGAPDRLLARSVSEMETDGSISPIDTQRWEERMEMLSSRGLRLLGVAYKPAADVDEATEDQDGLQLDLADDLTFLGVVGIVDPPRPEAAQAIRESHGAGVNVKMITGDHVGTATAIAAELGIGEDHDRLEALTGAELEEMSDDELAAVVTDVDVFARTSPEHKIRIVRALQSKGQVVAMTGDGVNDAPSIAMSDVGVAMGIKGTEATKEAADIVLQDDNFSTIASAIEEGRRIYDNVRKSVSFLLPTNGAQSLVILVAVIAGWTLPLTPVQILWINLVTAVTLSLPLAVEPAEPGIMDRPPRSEKEQILSGKTLWLVIAVSFIIGTATVAAFVIMRNQGEAGVMLSQTVALNALAFAQLAYMFNCRVLSGSSFTTRAFVGNRTVWIAAGALLVLQLALVYLPPLNFLFGTRPMGVAEWGLVIGLSVVVFLIVEAVKALQRQLAKD